MSSTSIFQILLGCVFAAAIALAAYRVRSLSKSGAWGALITGTLIFGLGGWQWAVLLLGFFVSASLLTRLFGKKKAALTEKFDKGGVRDFGQVFANGGVASIFAILHFIFPEASWTWIGFAASMAAVNADTWATEIGVLNPSMPRLITNGKVVERGTSGGISIYGTLAALCGSAFIALLMLVCTPSLNYGNFPAAAVMFLLVTASGLMGAIFDSLLGATVQAIYHCPQCKKETEKHPRHTCGTETAQVRGWKWLNNDMVNVGCAVVGALVGVILLS